MNSRKEVTDAWETLCLDQDMSDEGEKKRDSKRQKKKKKKLLCGNMLSMASAIPPREKSNSTAILSSCPPTCIPTPSRNHVTTM